MTVEASDDPGKKKENSNPLALSRYYYSLDLQETTEVNVCLHQEDRLVGNNALYKEYLYCSLLLL